MKPTWLLLSLSLALAGCGGPAPEDAHPHDEAAAGHDHHEEEGHDEGGVSYDADHGLALTPAVAAALGVETADVETRTLAGRLALTAQVFTVRPEVRASARITPETADGLRGTTSREATLVRIDRSGAAATHLVDAVFALAGPPDLKPGDFVTIALRTAASAQPVVPESAVLDTAAGAFAYVASDGFYRRVPITTGARADGAVAVTSGLQAGDRVVVAPVGQLWLAELRLTKGGGHSH